jgi:putative SOS response-associated peptidase YedK
MCGRFVQYSDPERYAERFGLDHLCHAEPRYNLAPTQPVLAIRLAAAGGRELVPLRWGLIPHWSKGPDSRYSMINARAETVATKPAYRDAFRQRRCLIPSEGFYEWRATEGGKQPYLIGRRDQASFLMAGLWDRWRSGEGDQSPIESCTIIVTDANALVRPVHDRMPVILSDEAADRWLDPEQRDLAALTELLRPADPAEMTLHPVSRAVNNARNDGPELLEPQRQQGS